ncbi:MAG: hypothetical protein DRI36_04615 [Caldiserica bacterium]|nr:MAG: hypothetical protein DRI36_04615 [Caldisericota bacterium]
MNSLEFRVERMSYFESKRRSLVKAITWRILAMIVLGIISYIFTKSLKKMTEITVVYTIVQIFVYFLHERIWEKIPWGRIKHPLSDLPVKEKLKDEDKKVIMEKLRELGYID